MSANNSNSNDPPPTTDGNSAGSRRILPRTESTDSLPALILLAPHQGFGRTVSATPTFAWFVRDSGSWPMEFKLYVYEANKTELVREIKDANFNSLPGIIVLSISSPVLSVGQRYSWEVKLCNPNHPSSDPFARAAIEVVQMPPDLKTQSSDRDRDKLAALYAKADLWYDTLGIVLAAGDDPRMRELKSSLLEQVAAASASREREIAKLTESTIHRVQR